MSAPALCVRNCIASGLLFTTPVPVSSAFTPLQPGWLVWKACSFARDVPQRPQGALGVIQHADLSTLHMHAFPWPNMSPMHWDSSNWRSLRISRSKTNISYSTSNNCSKPEETMLFLQVCFKSTQIILWSQSYNSVKLDTFLDSHRKY